jgi:hypothetical protein
MALVTLQTLFQDAFPCNCNGSISFTARRDNTGRRGRRVRENRPPAGRTFGDNERAWCDNSAITTSSGTRAR